MLLCLVGLILPNALAFGAEMLSIGLAPRTMVIVLYAVPPLFARFLHPLVIAALYLAILVFDVANCISTGFYFSYGELLRSVHLGTNLDLLASPLYAALLVGMVALLCTNLALLCFGRRFYAAGNRSVLAALVLGVALVDMAANMSAHYDFGPFAAWNQPFESAVESSGFGQLAEAPSPHRNVMLVLVESLGVLRDPAQNALLMAPFRDPALLQRYDVSVGGTTFFGATSHGEMRELCHTRDSYTDVLSGDDPVCLPDVFAGHGYRTVSVHGFTHAFYERDRWYPKVGFVKSVFHEDLRHPFGHKGRSCGGALPSTCDVDIADAIDERLGQVTQPVFLYWLTLNTHVPVRMGDAKPRYGCAAKGGPFGDAEVCSMVELWSDLFEAVNGLALRHEPMEILLVGDHAPPLWRRQARDMFEPGQVPWIRLTPKALPPPSVTAEALP